MVFCNFFLVFYDLETRAEASRDVYEKYLTAREESGTKGSSSAQFADGNGHYVVCDLTTYKSLFSSTYYAEAVTEGDVAVTSSTIGGSTIQSEGEVIDLLHMLYLDQ